MEKHTRKEKRREIGKKEKDTRNVYGVKLRVSPSPFHLSLPVAVRFLIKTIATRLTSITVYNRVTTCYYLCRGYIIWTYEEEGKSLRQKWNIQSLS